MRSLVLSLSLLAGAAGAVPQAVPTTVAPAALSVSSPQGTLYVTREVCSAFPDEPLAMWAQFRPPMGGAPVDACWKRIHDVVFVRYTDGDYSAHKIGDFQPATLPTAQ